MVGEKMIKNIIKEVLGAAAWALAALGLALFIYRVIMWVME